MTEFEKYTPPGKRGRDEAAATASADAALADPNTVTLGGGGRPPTGPFDIRTFDIERINDIYALVIVGGRSVILEENWKILGLDATPPHDRVRFVTLEAFANWHANDLYQVEGKHYTAAYLWLRDRQRRQYPGIVFDPSKPPGGASGTYYNLWQGFSVEPSEYGSCTIFLDHLRTNVAAGNDGHGNYIFGWFADMIQNPTDRKGVALALRGKMGAGKTVVGLHVGRLFESNYALVDAPRYVVGNFNAHLARLLLLQADEGFWAGDKQAEGRLKGLITSDRQMIELKGKDPIQVKNYVHLLVTSNEEWVVPAGHDERRFAIFDVTDHVLQNIPYFAAMEAELKAKDGSGYARLLWELQHFNLAPVELRTVPKTAALYEQKLASLSNLQSWWLACLQRGWITHEPPPGAPPGPEAEASEPAEPWPQEVECERLHRSYLYFCERHGIRRPAAQAVWGRELHRVVPKLVRGKAKGSRSEKRPYVYQLPPLDACRAHFETLIRTAIDWETGDPLASEPAAGPA